MDLPCYGSKLKKDYDPPFTCGSDTRRSIIKYFVRDEINRNSAGNSLAEELVRMRIQLLKAAWNDTRSYACDCLTPTERRLHGKNSLSCCKALDAETATESCTCLDGETESVACCENSNNFMPDALAGVLFDEIPAKDVVGSIMERVQPYLTKILTTREGNRAFTRYNDEAKVAQWDWTTTGMGETATKASGLFSTTDPIMHYNASEAGYPFKGGQTIWEMCTGLVSQVMFTMPVAPLVVNATSGDWMWTAASVLGLHGSAKLAFDPSLPKDFDGDANAKDSGLSMLERYVAKLMEASFEDSSLFWHYAMRHVPSPSLACASGLGASANQKPDGTAVQFVDDVGIPSDASHPPVIAHHMPPPSGNGSVPAYGYGAFPLGNAGARCFCGWSLVETPRRACRIPAPICSAVPEASASGCTYAPNTAHGRATLEAVLAAWESESSSSKASWPCPDMDLSDAWGIMSPRDAEAWIASANRTDGTPPVRLSDILRAGRAGLRAGNAKTLGKSVRADGMWPSKRVHKLLPDDDASSTGAALNRCSDTILRTFDAKSVAREMVDDLFPVAQGIHESAPMSFCLRYAIEYARLRMLRAVSSAVAGASSAPFLDAEIRTQKSVVDRWRGRCESQLNMLAVCKSNALLDTVPAKEFAYDCPFVITDDYNATRSYYVTPAGCLLYHQGSFYNPCRMASLPCRHDGTKKTRLAVRDVTLQGDRTRIRFDVRSAGSGEILGSWPLNFFDESGSKNAVASQVVQRILRWQATSSSSTGEEDALFEAENVGEDAQQRAANIPWRLSRAFISDIYMQGGRSKAARGSVGNTQPQGTKGWGNAEGLVTDAGSEAAEFCDGIADWWPDDWTKPVGYHVTLPCSSAQAGYRTFDAAFALDADDSTADGTPIRIFHMRYMHTTLRDQDAYHSR